MFCRAATNRGLIADGGSWRVKGMVFSMRTRADTRETKEREGEKRKEKESESEKDQEGEEKK